MSTPFIFDIASSMLFLPSGRRTDLSKSNNASAWITTAWRTDAGAGRAAGAGAAGAAGGRRGGGSGGSSRRGGSGRRGGPRSCGCGLGAFALRENLAGGHDAGTGTVLHRGTL